MTYNEWREACNKVNSTKLTLKDWFEAMLILAIAATDIDEKTIPKADMTEVRLPCDCQSNCTYYANVPVFKNYGCINLTDKENK